MRRRAGHGRRWSASFAWAPCRRRACAGPIDAPLTRLIGWLEGSWTAPGGAARSRPSGAASAEPRRVRQRDPRSARPRRRRRRRCCRPTMRRSASTTWPTRWAVRRRCCRPISRRRGRSARSRSATRASAPGSDTYSVRQDLSQDQHLEGLPLGTVGGLRRAAHVPGRRRVRVPGPAVSHQPERHPRPARTRTSSS